MLLIEGPDLVGKSRLCNTMCAALGDRHPSHRKPLTDHFGLGDIATVWSAPDPVAVLSNRRGAPQSWMVVDRAWISEVVYGYVVRERPSFTPRTLQRLLGHAKSSGLVTVIIYADDDAYERLLDLHHDRGEAFDREQLRRVNRAYRHLALSGRMGEYEIHADVVWDVTAFNAKLQYPSADAALLASLTDLYTSRVPGGLADAGRGRQS